MPGHSGGFCHGLKSAGIKCCTNGGMGVPQIEDDPAGVSAALVTRLLHEMAGLFPDEVLHIGGDETGSSPPCTLADSKSWEQKMITYVQGTLHKQVMGWEEVVFKTGAASGNDDVIVDSWARSSWQQAAALDHRTVASNSGNLYLDIHSSVASHQWADLRAGTSNASLLGKLLGGETSMWQDFYVPGARSKASGSASCLFDDSRDADFSNSTASTVWPRAAVAAGAFWRYTSALDATPGSDGAPLFEQVVSDIKVRLAARGVGVCPCATGSALGCEQNSYCGHVWCPGG
jgi:N-acetyl-beta-hexosaminidase